MTTDRRSFLRGLGLSLGAATALGSLGITTRQALADVTAADRKFLFVFNNGGWDPTTVFAPLFGLPTVDLEPDAQPMDIGGLRLVDSALRPSVRAFFQRWHERCAVLNGVSVRSLSHEICRTIALTGDSGGLLPDWATRLADERRGEHTLPHLVLGGPSYAGDLGAAVARSGASGQLDQLLTGDILEGSDQPTDRPGAAAEGVIDRWMRRRAAARRDGAVLPADQVLAADFAEAIERAGELEAATGDVTFTGGASLTAAAPTVVEALSSGLSRCVSVSEAVSWDTHANNTQQSQLFEGFFGRLGGMLDQLQAAPGEQGGSLLDETVVVVMSEMGRTPKLNASQGKDHWPYTSYLLLGSGLAGSRMYGGYDDLYYGSLVDPATAQPADDGVVVGASSVGATLLALAGADPSVVSDGVVLRGMLA